MGRVDVDTAGWVRTLQGTETVDVRLGYDPEDPVAVTVEVTGEGRRSTWVFARDLLADGLRSMTPLGEGRIQVQATSVLAEITVLREDGDVEVLRLPWWNTREFIRRTVDEVARGSETCDVDGWLAALTASPE
jgi:hypothetical protein